MIIHPSALIKRKLTSSYAVARRSNLALNLADNEFKQCFGGNVAGVLNLTNEYKIIVDIAMNPIKKFHSSSLRIFFKKAEAQHVPFHRLDSY